MRFLRLCSVTKALFKTSAAKHKPQHPKSGGMLVCFKALPSHFIVIDNQIKFLFYHSIDFYRVKVSWVKCKPKVGVHYGLAWTPSGSVERQGKQSPS